MDVKNFFMSHGIKLKDGYYGSTSSTMCNLDNPVSVREYQKYEFCKAVDCRYHYPEGISKRENCAAAGKKQCPYTAKEFHHWLKNSGFEIVKMA